MPSAHFVKLPRAHAHAYADTASGHEAESQETPTRQETPMSPKQVAYDDGEIRCDDQGLSIRHYYPWAQSGFRTARSKGWRRSR